MTPKMAQAGDSGSPATERLLARDLMTGTGISGNRGGKISKLDQYRADQARDLFPVRIRPDLVAYSESAYGSAPRGLGGAFRPVSLFSLDRLREGILGGTQYPGADTLGKGG